MPTRTGRERPEKILVAMHALSGGNTGFLGYEDIVVSAFQLFPDEFALRGYPQYPDSSDIHKPLYGVLTKQGLVRAAQKRFALTQRGVEVAQRLVGNAGASLDEVRSPERLGRSNEDELDRMLKSAAYQFCVIGEHERILDTDFYAFLGCTVRTARNVFQGRLTASTGAIGAARRLSKPDAATAKKLSDLMAFLRKRFSKEIAWKVGNDGTQERRPSSRARH